jgi:hypothetical protein
MLILKNRSQYDLDLLIFSYPNNKKFTERVCAGKTYVYHPHKFFQKITEEHKACKTKFWYDEPDSDSDEESPMLEKKEPRNFQFYKEVTNFFKIVALLGNKKKRVIASHKPVRGINVTIQVKNLDDEHFEIHKFAH